MKKANDKPNIVLEHIEIDESFWAKKREMIARGIINYQWDVLNDNIPGTEPSHAIENFRIAAGESDKDFFGMVFQDSDVAKWIEAASYSLSYHPNPELEKKIDDLIDLIEKTQQPNGYLNTYFTVAKPDQRWTDMSFGHELYCAGHMIEAAVAYSQVTGKNKFLNLMLKYTDYIDTLFGPEKNKMKKYPGHEEIELALIKLFHATGEKRYLKLSQFFIDIRGKVTDFLLNEKTFGKGNLKSFNLDYHQAHLPVRQQDTAEGHAVRAMYLYSAMADLALETDDPSLLNALKALWENVTKRRMYITGALGSQGSGERFTFDYDLPNSRAHAETCASIGLLFWAYRMTLIEQKSTYADIFEKALYNTCLAGISYDGKKYFYCNPLEVFPEAVEKRFDLRHLSQERLSWHGCACCPPNIVRLIASLDKYIYSCSENTIYIHQYINSKAEVNTEDSIVSLIQRTEYPWKGRINIIIDSKSAKNFTLALRIPEWCRDYTCTINGKDIDSKKTDKGYLKLDRRWNKADKVELTLAMNIVLMQANCKVRENKGKVAIQRGPLVYCLEEADNGTNLADIDLTADSKFTEEYDPDFFDGMVVIRGNAVRSDESKWNDVLYQEKNTNIKPVTITAVPYFIWGNRTAGEMLVWISHR